MEHSTEIQADKDMEQMEQTDQDQAVQVQQVMTVSVGVLCRALIKKAHDESKHISNEELAKKVVGLFKEQNVEVKTSAACIAWYKNDMRKKGVLPSGTSAGRFVTINLDDVDL